jgi:L-seryl-tRNA(Ser) seleniumtransferase
MGFSSADELLRSIPSVDRLWSSPLLAPLKAAYEESLLKAFVRRAIEDLRGAIRSGAASEDQCAPEYLAARITELAARRVGRKLKTVINATGVIIHTNLGRSVLSKRAAERVAEAALHYSNLEYDLEKGRRGERNAHLRGLINELTGAEAALAVNNNAAAVLLALSTLARGREVIVSRGELIEIGGSFRVPEVMAESGAILREVGTTNRTHPRDYANAINERTALILKVHPSNYRIEGFTREVSLDELAALGRERGVPTMMDLGSGCLVDLTAYGLEEQTVRDALAAGVDLVAFSGDKLLGGPQAGVLAGRAALIDKIRSNPLARALRMDKLTLAALEATLEEYTKPEGAAHAIPTVAMITRPAEELRRAAEVLAGAIVARANGAADVSIQPGSGRVGGGALPMGELPGPRVVVQPVRASAGRVERELRAGSPPIVALVRDDAILMDPRTLLEGQNALVPELVAAAIRRAAAN